MKKMHQINALLRFQSKSKKLINLCGKLKHDYFNKINLLYEHIKEQNIGTLSNEK